MTVQDELTAVTRGLIYARNRFELARARVAYPNFDEMPVEGQIDCLVDLDRGPFVKRMFRNLAMRELEAAYPVLVTADEPGGTNG